MPGKIEGRRKRRRDEMVEWHHQLNGHEFSQTQGEMKDRETWCAAVHWAAKSPTQLSD